MRYLIYAGVGVAALAAIVVAVGAMLPKEHVATRSALFKQPADKIFAIISGPPDWRPDVKSFEALPPRDGHPCWREVDKHGDGVTFERLEADPPRRMVTRIADKNLPYGGSWIHELREAPGGTLLRVSEHGEVYNPIFRFMSRFVFGYTASLENYLKALGEKLGETAQIEE